METGLVGAIVLVADIYAILQIVQSTGSTGSKALWIALVVLLPVLGLIIWFFLGPKAR